MLGYVILTLLRWINIIGMEGVYHTYTIFFFRGAMRDDAVTPIFEYLNKYFELHIERRSRPEEMFKGRTTG